jgi:hypothetical protein
LGAPSENLIPHSLRLFGSEAEAALGGGLQVARRPILAHNAFGGLLTRPKQKATDLVSHSDAQNWSYTCMFGGGQIPNAIIEDRRNIVLKTPYKSRYPFFHGHFVDRGPIVDSDLDVSRNPEIL